MINLFGDGPYLIGIAELALEALEELVRYFLHVFPIAAAAFLLRRRLFGRVEWAAALLLMSLQTAYVWSASIRSEFFLSFCLAALLVAELYLFCLIPLRPLDCAFLFAAFLFPVRLFNSTSALVGHLWIFWLLFCALHADLKMASGKLCGKQFLCYFHFVFLSLSMYLYELGILALQPRMTRFFGGNAPGTAVSVLLVTALLLGAAQGLKAGLGERLKKLNSLAGKYRNIERSFFFCSLCILILFTMIYLPFTALRMQNALVALLIPVLCLVFLAAQLPFIALLLRIALYRDTDTFRQWERASLASYYSELENSVSSMREMRHDIKNIFYTMGNFVDRNDDPEMKRFFWEKIYPYSEKTIRQSELLSKIYQIPAESLRAFFHLKISCALRQGIAVSLDVSLVPEAFQAGMDIIDLTRILGILLDNAIEETALVPDGILEIKVAGNSGGCSYHVKNPVTERTQKNGVRPGTTVKGEGHGNGLKIAEELLEQYPNAVLNSVLQAGSFVQSLNILF